MNALEMMIGLSQGGLTVSLKATPKAWVADLEGTEGVAESPDLAVVRALTGHLAKMSKQLADLMEKEKEKA